MTLQRKWKTNEVQLKGRYDYSETNNHRDHRPDEGRRFVAA